MKVLRTSSIAPLIWLASGAFVFVLALAATVLVLNLRQTALHSAEALVGHIATDAEASLNRNLLSLDLLLSSVLDQFQLQAGSDVASQNRSLSVISRDNLLVGRLAVLGAQGQVLAASGGGGLAQGLSLPANFWAEVTASPMQRLHISAPVRSAATTQQVLYFARPLGGVGAQARWAVAEVPLAKVSTVGQGHDLSGLEILFEKTNGQRLLAVPDLPPQADASRKAPEEAASPAGAWGVPARISGQSALVVQRPLVYPDLRVSVSLPETVALATWRTERNTVAGVTALFCAMVLLAAAATAATVGRLNAARQETAYSKAMLDQALESMVGGFLLLDQDQRVVHWNQRYVELFPFMREALSPQLAFREVLNTGVASLLPGSSPAERQQWVEQRLILLQQTAGSHDMRLPDGRRLQVTERRTPEGGTVITYHDVTALRRAREEVENLAFYDPLTGLPNRRLLLDRLGQSIMLAQRSGRVGALLFLDLDHFKALNDTKGHEVGDVLLQQVAQRLQANVRVADTVARLGGDEFVIMLSDLASERQEAGAQAQRIGEKVLRSLSEPFYLGDYVYQGAASVGATLFGAQAESAVELLRRADIAMYQVKAQRGNGLCFFDPRMQTTINERAQLEADLRQDFKAGKLQLHYQPQCLPSGAIVGAECLLRWPHAERGMVSPAQFIPVAENSDLILALGDWVLRTACQQLAAWRNHPQCAHVQLSVNVSARQFRQADFVHQVIEVLQTTGAKAHLLMLELTESLVLDNVDDTVEKMHLLRTKGVRFAVDDFGTGHSSLSYLTRLPLHQLKIDQSFVRNLGVRPTDDVIVQTIIGMGANLDLEIIAEGVETQGQKDFLAAHGCDLYQGYLLGRPGPVDVLQARLEEAAPPLAA